jgi:hypothetical protein
MNALEIIKQGNTLPAELQQAFDETANITERVTVNSLSPGGKKWTVHMNGKPTVLMTTQDGEKVPAGVVTVVVVDANQHRSRAYYRQSYNPENPLPPDCWSNDGETPDASIPIPQHSNCKSCPMAAKNSRINDNGQGVVACGLQKFLVVQLAMKGKDGWKLVDVPLLRLKLSITSIWDGKSPDLQKEGWFAWDNLVDFLRTNGYRNTAQVVLKLKFDPATAYPKVIFSPAHVLGTDPSDVSFAREILALKKDQADVIESMLSRDWTPAGSDGVPTDPEDPPPVQEEPLPEPPKKTEAPKARAKRAEPKPAPAPEPVVEEEDAPFEMAEVIVPAAKAPTAPAKKETPKAIPEAELGDVTELADMWGDD